MSLGPSDNTSNRPNDSGTHPPTAVGDCAHCNLVSLRYFVETTYNSGEAIPTTTLSPTRRMTTMTTRRIPRNRQGSLLIASVLVGTVTRTTMVMGSSTVPGPPPPPPPPPVPVMDYYAAEETVLDQDFTVENHASPYSSWSATATVTGPTMTTTTAATSVGKKISGPRAPIHYEFPVRMEAFQGTDGNQNISNNDGTDLTAARASPRQDLITRYMMTSAGKVNVHLSATVVGGMFGLILAKSLLPFGTTFWSTVGASVFLSSSLFLRTPFGELVRALALSLILVLQRTNSIRKRYPTWNYVQGFLSFGTNSSAAHRSKKIQTRPFPPCKNPWKYQPQRPSDPEFNMLYSLIAMAFVGSTCGATLSLPLIPNWIASLAGAATMALATTVDSPRGDLARTMGMRVVALGQELWDIQAKLGIIPKAAIVSSQIIDKCMILDKQHKVKDKFLRLVNAGYEQVLQTADRVQTQRLDRTSSGGGRRDEEGKANYYPNEGEDHEETGRRRRPDSDQPYPGAGRQGIPRFVEDDNYLPNRQGDARDVRRQAPGRVEYDNDTRGGPALRDEYEDDKDDSDALAKKKRGWFGR